MFSGFGAGASAIFPQPGRFLNARAAENQPEHQAFGARQSEPYGNNKFPGEASKTRGYFLIALNGLRRKNAPAIPAFIS
jgi:hypothetical protein